MTDLENRYNKTKTLKKETYYKVEIKHEKGDLFILFISCYVFILYIRKLHYYYVFIMQLQAT